MSEQGQRAEHPSMGHVRQSLERVHIIHEHFCCNRGFAALAREASLVNCERDKQGVRDRRDSKIEALGQKFRTLQPLDRLACPAFRGSLASFA